MKNTAASATARRPFADLTIGELYTLDDEMAAEMEATRDSYKPDEIQAYEDARRVSRKVADEILHRTGGIDCS